MTTGYRREVAGNLPLVPVAPATGDPVWVGRDGPVATIWLNRPEKRNAMTYAMWAALGAACATLAHDRTVRVVVVRGSGPHFCAGADINDLHAERPLGEPSFVQVNVDAEHALAALPKPTVAFVDGDCIGGGCAIAIDCDLRVATPAARFGITPAKLGIVYPPSSLERVVHLLGPAAAKHLLYTGDLVDASRALHIGLVDEVVATDLAEERMSELCAHLAGRSLLTQAATKEMVASVLAHGSVPSEVADRWSREVAMADDPAEGVAAFTARRTPRFTWSGRADDPT